MDITALANWLRGELTSIPVEVIILFGIALLMSGRGFYQTVHFISTGYGFSIDGMAIASLFLFRHNLSWYSTLHGILLAVYGLRLGIYLIRRELQPSYKDELKSVQKRSSGLSIGQNFLIWIGVSILYVMMFSPALLGLAIAPMQSSPAFIILQAIGLLTMIGGLSIEALADQQKTVFKAQFPKQFCNTGLYRWVRCPNYLGEIIFWVGNWTAGLTFYTSALHWVASLVGLICIVLIMMGSTKRLEQAQQERYGHLPEYQTFVQVVPVLFPFVPIYSLKNIRVYLE
jgi:steroid 5-alpha reductase family enzyme